MALNKPQSHLNEWIASTRTMRIKVPKLIAMLLFGVIGGYVFLELRMWYWGAESSRGTYVSHFSQASYQGAKALMLVLVLAMAFLLKFWRSLRDTPGLVLLLIWCALSIGWSARVFENIEQFVLILTTVATAALIARSFETIRQIHFMAQILAVGLLMCVAFAILVPSIGLMRGGAHDGALRGLLFHKNHFGAYAAFAFCYFFALFKLESIWRYGALALLAGCCVFLSGSASAVVMLLAAIAISGISAVTLNWSSGTRKMFAWGLLLLLPILGWFMSTFRVEILGFLGRDATLTHRTGIWAVVWDHLQEHPFVLVFGSGPSGASANTELIAAMQKLSGYRGVTTTHSAFLDIIINFGVIGLLAFAAINIATLTRAFQVYTKTSDRAYTVCSVLVIQIIVLFHLRNFVTSESGMVGSFPLLMFICAVLLSSNLRIDMRR